jgi:hypothetical protein
VVLRRYELIYCNGGPDIARVGVGVAETREPYVGGGVDRGPRTFVVHKHGWYRGTKWRPSLIAQTVDVSLPLGSGQKKAAYHSIVMINSKLHTCSSLNLRDMRSNAKRRNIFAYGSGYLA